MDTVSFFKTPNDFRRWLMKNHAAAAELWVGFHKVNSVKPSITWKESVDEALCFGWIDGVRKSIDDLSYKIRFTPRRTKSNWSRVNIKRVGELTEAGRMTPDGIAAFAASKAKRRDHSYEQTERRVDSGVVKAIRANKTAWAYWQAQPPGYQKTASFWVVSAKKPETRARRLQALIDDCANGKRIGAIAIKAT